MDNYDNIITLEAYSEDEAPSTSRQRHESSESNSPTPPSPSPGGSPSPGRTVTFASPTSPTPTPLNATQAQPGPEVRPWSGRVTLTRRLTPSNSVRPLPRPALLQSPRPQVNEFRPRALNALSWSGGRGRLPCSPQSGNPPTLRAPSPAASSPAQQPRPAVRPCACSHSGDIPLAPKVAQEADHPIYSILTTQMMTIIFTSMLWWVVYLLTRSA